MASVPAQKSISKSSDNGLGKYSFKDLAYKRYIIYVGPVEKLALSTWFL